MNALWNTTPRTLEELLNSLEAVKFYETVYGEAAPMEHSIILTNDLMTDLMRRILRLEAENGF